MLVTGFGRMNHHAVWFKVAINVYGLIFKGTHARDFANLVLIFFILTLKISGLYKLPWHAFEVHVSSA